jgi:hypothetical protein
MKTKSVAVSLVAFLCVFFALAVFAQVPDKPTGVPLTGAELNKMFERGALLDTHNPNGAWKGSIVLSASGLAFAQWLAGASGGQDVGTWRIVEDTVCLEWKLPHGFARGGEEQCYRHYRVGDNAYQTWYVANGKFNFAYQLRQ